MTLLYLGTDPQEQQQECGKRLREELKQKDQGPKRGSGSTGAPGGGRASGSKPRARALLNPKRPRIFKQIKLGKPSSRHFGGSSKLRGVVAMETPQSHVA